MGKNDYIDGKLLKEELHSFSRSYRQEVKKLYQDHIKKVKQSRIDNYCDEQIELKKKELSLEAKKKGQEVISYITENFNESEFRKKMLKSFKYNIIYKKAYKDAHGIISDKLGEMFLKLAEKLSSKKNWIGYTYKDEMVGKGILFLCKYAHGFNKYHPKSNAFAYVTQICKNGFIQVLQKEEKQSHLKDKMIKNSIDKSELDKWLEV